MSEKPNLNEMFQIDDNTVQIRTTLNRLGHEMRKMLATGKQTIAFELDRDIAAVMAELLILDDTP